ncbi:NYN domain-containing protein [Rhodococcus hoagii]|nr:NYN domain-containing protein [Prescottella equi]MBM4653967.1 NYN domain-containing protein [Prescottella equi]MBM4719767.1 NYN domain-containing protein [Prescottella equi]NKR23567.1 NYN domain-containing protein [Prescottella equi]NKT56279.1 NYN domain-containing protein [Prescottella equi]
MDPNPAPRKHKVIFDAFNVLDGFSNLLAYGDSVNAYDVNIGLLADVIADKDINEVEVAAISVHLGVCDSTLHPTRHASEMARIRKWERDSRVKVHARPSWFNEFTGAYEEKGVDTAMALDLCMSQASGQYDKITVFTADSDMLPALEHAYDASGAGVDLARWVGQPSRLWLPGRKLWCHYLDAADLARCVTRRNNRSAA